MQVLQNVVNFVLGLGSTLFMPLFMILVGLLVGMKFMDAFEAGLLLGVAFVSVNMVTSFLGGAITPTVNAFAQATGKEFECIDIGWTPCSAITWTWSYIFLLFPILIGVNLAMVLANLTKTLDVDFWNVWGLGCTGVIVKYYTGSPWIGLAVSTVEIVMSLFFADATAPYIHNEVGIPGISLPHNMVMAGPVLWLLDKIFCFIPGVKDSNINADWLKEKLGMFGEQYMIGFILGTLLSLVARFSIKDSLIVGINLASAFMVLPMVSKLFMQALEPISTACGDFMKEHLNGKEVWIGLDWPFLAGENVLWVCEIISAPVGVLFAMILPGNKTLPLAGVMLGCPSITALCLCRGNLLRMALCVCASVPLELYAATYMGTPLTALAGETGVYDVPAGHTVTMYGGEGSVFRMLVCMTFAGNIVGIVGLVAFFACFFFMIKDQNATNKALYGENA